MPQAVNSTETEEPNSVAIHPRHNAKEVTQIRP